MQGKVERSRNTKNLTRLLKANFPEFEFRAALSALVVAVRRMHQFAVQICIETNPTIRMDMPS